MGSEGREAGEGPRTVEGRARVGGGPPRSSLADSPAWIPRTYGVTEVEIKLSSHSLCYGVVFLFRVHVSDLLGRRANELAVLVVAWAKSAMK